MKETSYLSPPRLSPNCSQGTKAASEETSPPHKSQMVSAQSPSLPACARPPSKLLMQATHSYCLTDGGRRQQQMSNITNVQSDIGTVSNAVGWFSRLDIKSPH